MYFFVIIFFLLFRTCHAEEENKDALALPNIEMGVPSMVAGCVNAITGDFIESSNDLIIPGPEPLVFQRSYCSSDICARYLCSGWRHNHGSYAKISQTKKVHSDTRGVGIKLYESGGYSAAFHGTYFYHKGELVSKPTFAHLKGERGFTNSNRGIISARTNPKNTRFRKTYKSSPLSYYPSSLNTTELEREGDYCFVKSETNLNGFSYCYTLSKVNAITGIQLKRNKIELSTLTLDFDHSKDDKEPYIRVTASDGRWVKYKLKKMDKTNLEKEHKTPSRYYIKSVLSHNMPQVLYEYQTREGRIPGELIVKKTLPANRFLEIDYNTMKKVGAEYVTDFRVNRVRCLKAPTGKDSNAHVIYQFEYSQKLDKNDNLIFGITNVYDANQNHTQYQYNEDFRLTHIRKLANKKLYTSEEYLWGKDKEAGYLKGKIIHNCQRKPLLARLYEYDEYGNITCDTIYGDISGKSPPLEWEAKNNSESYSTHYTYDDLHHIVKEEQDNGKGILYIYYKNTDRLSGKFVTDNGIICLRTFYFYDQDSILEKIITDDGRTKNLDDFTGVTERHITTYKNRDQAPYGLPEVVSNYYLDLQTKKRVLLGEVHNDYSSYGELIRQTHYDSNQELRYTLEWTYDEHGNLIKEKNALGETTIRKYDANDNLVYEKRKYEKRFIYDCSNRLVKTEIKERDNSYSTDNRYDLMSNCVMTTDLSGNQTKFEYDGIGRQNAVIHPVETTYEGEKFHAKESIVYNELNYPIRKIDSNEEVIRTSFNIHGKPTNIIYPDGTKETFEYNLDGTTKKATARNESYTLFTVDTFGRITTKEQYGPNGDHLGTETYVYNALHLLEETDPEGRTTKYKYDGAGRKSQVVRGDNLTTYHYDTLGRIEKTCEYYTEHCRITHQKYDLLGRIIEEQVEDSATGDILKRKTLAYDREGNITQESSYTEAGIATVQTQYNALGKPILVLDPEGQETHYEYNYHFINENHNHVLQITETDPLGNQIVTTMTTRGKPASIIRKDPFGELLSKRNHYYSSTGDIQTTVETIITPGQKNRKVVTEWEKDFEHKITKLIEAKGETEQRITTIKYNHFGQKQALIKPDGTRISHQYDPKGRIERIGPYQYTYDRTDMPIKIEDLENGTETIRQYDKNYRLIRETLANGLTLNYAYDLLGRPIEVTLPDKSQVNYTYDALYLKQVHRAPYTHHYDEYDQAGNLLKSTLPGNCGTETYVYNLNKKVTHINATTMKYDPLGNLESIIRDEEETRYTYDNLNQIKEEKGRTNHTYTSDSVHNIVKKDNIPRKHNSLNQMMTNGRESYIYDTLGNRLEDTRQKYEYDQFDRLTSIIREDKKWEYQYDPMHRRMVTKTYHKENDQWRPTKETLHLYQGENEVGSYEENRITQYRVLGVGKGAEIGATVAIEIEQNIYIPTHDHNGSVIGLRTLDGQIVEKYHYTAFGEEEEGSSVGNPWRFSSKRVDETGLIFFGRRYYEPSTGRWLTPDPLGYEAGPNLYAYVNNRPLTQIDLYGLYGLTNSGRPAFLNNIRSGLNTIAGIVGAGMCLVGNSMALVGEHCLPVPIARDLISGFGHMLYGKTSWIPVRSRQGSRLLESGNSQHLKGVAVSFCNGVMSSSKSVQEEIDKTSALRGGQKIHACYNSTEGFSTDMGECFFQQFSFKTDVVTKQVEILKQLLSEYSIVIHEAHSQGGLILYEALKFLTPEERKRLEVYTYGTAKVIDSDEWGLRRAQNYISTRDPVPFISDYNGVVRGSKKGDGTVQFLEASGNGISSHFFDHFLDNDTYRQRRGIIWDQLIEQHR